MAFLTINSKTFHSSYHGHSRVMGSVLALFENDLISHCSLSAYRSYIATLEKDNYEQPILPDLGITTVEVDERSEFGKSIQGYLNENGEDSISELVFDVDNQTFKVDEAARDERLNGRLLADIRRQRDQRIAEIEWVINRHQRETLLSINPTLKEKQIKQVHQYIQDLADFPKKVDLKKVAWPTKPDFI